MKIGSVRRPLNQSEICNFALILGARFGLFSLMKQRLRTITYMQEKLQNSDWL